MEPVTLSPKKDSTCLSDLGIPLARVGPILAKKLLKCSAKRLGTALRKLCTQSKKKGVTLGGRGWRKLNLPTILKLTAYYGVAIRAHPNNLDDMTDAVCATYYHAISTDDTPQHE